MPRAYLRRHRIESLIRESLAPLIKSALPAGSLFTIRRISLNNDFSVATVVYTTIDNVGGASNANNADDANDIAALQSVLEEQAWRCRRRLAQSLNMRKTPQLQFIHDTEGLAADKMRQMLEAISEENREE